MERTEILSGVDLKKLRAWLENVDGHAVRSPEFFLGMWLLPAFVRRFTREHKFAMPTDRNSREPVIGVSDYELLNELAWEIGADTSEGNRMHGVGKASSLWAKACLKRLDEIEREESSKHSKGKVESM